MKALLSAVLITPLAACADQPEASDSANLRHYSCDHGATFSVQDKGDTVDVMAGGQTYHLRATPSPNGQTYSDGHVQYWVHQDMGALSGAAAGPYDQCQIH